MTFFRTQSALDGKLCDVNETFSHADTFPCLALHPYEKFNRKFYYIKY